MGFDTGRSSPLRRKFSTDEFDKIPKKAISKKPVTKDWPSKLKEVEWQIKYPAEKESVPTDWKDTVSEIGDPTVTMPAKKDTKEVPITTIPEKKGTYSVQMTTIPAKSTKKDYDFPEISIEGEDSSLAKLFKSIPKD